MTLADISEVVPCYEDDFVLWAERQVELLRLQRLDKVDIPRLIEEIVGIIARDRHELRRRLDALITLLMNWEYQPDCRTRGMKVMLAEQRFRLADLLEFSPSLRDSLPKLVPNAYQHAVALTSISTGIDRDFFAKDCPFSLAEILEQP